MLLCQHGQRLYSLRLSLPSLFRRSIHQQKDLLGELRSRGLITEVTRPDVLTAELDRERVGVYAGVDPTAKSLHVGHLLPLLCLLHFQLYGHRIIPLIGGATGLIGDPSGRNTERPLSSEDDVRSNVEELSKGVKRFFERALSYAQKRLGDAAADITDPDVRNNLNWFKDLGFLEFLRTVGIHSRVNAMLARDSVRTRLESQSGISFTEFTYQLMQAYDFYMLHKHADCSIQIGGSDQWGNIIAGLDLINRMNPSAGESTEKGFGIVTPLLTTATGEKFGKSAGNAVSLDERITNVFDFYQFFLRTSDADVARYLKMFTLLPVAEIDAVNEAHRERPEARSAQHLLAEEVTILVHGDVGLQRARTATRVLFENDLTTTEPAQMIEALRGLPLFHICGEDELMTTEVTKLAVKYGLASSNGAARQLVNARGLYVNNLSISEFSRKLSKGDLIGGQLAILRAGRQRQIVLALEAPIAPI
ncbi:tyrosyl-tRNA synthetase [Obba rivulosa]|uniref:Tyrosine--tRNA ligase n=1 Tax=Obba rivulosa TaxID=1052685 RepID=A0A8E2DM53_9APHY|nr:tyrosyl-tRNA synthetase [Obba rivulosa]